MPLYHIPSLLRVVTFVCALFSLTSNSSGAQNFYVDPVNGSDAPEVDGTRTGTAFRSMARARDAVRVASATQSEDIIVNLRNGDYAFTSALNFSEADSGRNGHRVIWQPFPGEFPVMEGGKQITGWTLHDSVNGIWKASVSTPENFRNLYVNGSRRERATRVGTLTSNASNWFFNAQGKPAGVYVADSALVNVTNPADMEVLWKRDWRHFVIPVTGVEPGGAGRKLILLDPTVFEWSQTVEYAPARPSTSAPFSISNAYEFLVAGPAGSFYLDRASDTVFYKKLPAEDMSTAKVMVPQFDGSFFNIAGSSPTDRVKNLTFRGLTFQHGGLLWAEQNGAICMQASYWANSPNTSSVPTDPAPTLGYRPAAAIDVRNADGLVFEENALEHLGGCGIALDTAVSNVAIRKNRISDISEGAITVSSWRNNNLNANEGPVNHITIENNYVESIGREYAGSVGILLFWVQDCVVQNNYVRNVPYSGISLGWGWAAANITNFSARNAVRNNRIEEYMREVLDGGGIYTLGRRLDASNGDVIQGNYCLDMYNRNAGLYADEGSAFTTWTNNVVENVTQFWLDMWTTTIRDNTVNNNYTTTASFRNNGTNNTITNTSVHTTADWPLAARAIIAAAGISSAHAAPVPTGFSARPNPTAGINLSWTAVPGALGYEIERRLAVGTPWTLLAELPAGSTSFVDTGSSESQAPVYRMRSVARLNDSVPVSTMVLSASAQSWSGATNGDWLTTTNWTGGVASGSTTASDTTTAVFSVNANNTIGINMTTTSGVYYLGAIHNTNANARIIQNTSGTTGILTLNGATVNGVANTILRNTTSTLLTIGNPGSGTLGLALGNATNNIIQVTSTGGITINSAISGSNGITRQGSGTGTLTLSGNNSYTGVTATNGMLTISNNNALGSTAGGSHTTIAANGFSTGPMLQLSGGITSAENISITGITEQASGYTGAIRSISGSNTLSGNITLASPTGGIRLEANGGNLTFSGNISQTGTSRDLVLAAETSARTLTVDNAIANNGGKLLIDQAGTVLLKGQSGSGIGATQMFGGTLRMGVADALNTNAELLLWSDSGTRTFDLAGFNQTINALTSGGSSASTARVVTNSATGTGTNTLTVGNGGGTGTFNGVINNGTTARVALTKTGAGTQTLSGANTYTGATIVNGGTLKLGANNVIPNASNVSIGTATLDVDTRTDTAGTLDVTGAAVINLGSGATLAFADSKAVDWTGGTLNITGTLGATSLRFGDSADDLTSGQLAKISVNGNGLGTYILNANGYLVPGGSLGPVNSFEISAISSPQTVGTPITGITITAKDASNATATSFTGTVTFGGTAGSSGTSGSFTAGVLTGVSVTPNVAGSNLTFTVDDGESHTGSTTITTIQTQYQSWAGGTLFDADTNNDGVSNGMAFLLGASSPTSAVRLPTVTENGGDLILEFNCLPDAARGSATLRVEHSSDLGVLDLWTSTTNKVPDASNAVADNHVTFVVGAGPVGPPALNNVKATINSAATTGKKLFARLKANQPQ